MIAQFVSINEPAEVCSPHGPLSIAAPANCYSLTLFTQRWKEVRDFYVDLLNAEVMSEHPGRYCEMKLAGIPLCLHSADQGETVSYLHLYIALPNRTRVMRELQNRGIIITKTGPYVNFRDPEGRVIKLSDDSSMVA